MYIFTVLPPSAQLVHMGLVTCTTDQPESTAVGYRDQLSPGQGVAAIFDQHSGYLAISYFKKRRMKKKRHGWNLLEILLLMKELAGSQGTFTIALFNLGLLYVKKWPMIKIITISGISMKFWSRWGASYLVSEPLLLPLLQMGNIQ